MMKKHISISIITVLITFMSSLLLGGASLAAEQVPDGEIDYPQNETNFDYRVSESPYLRLSEDMLSWPAMESPETGSAVKSEDPTEVEIYNVATGEITNLPSDNFLTDESIRGITSLE
jgi:hypothetical protein